MTILNKLTMPAALAALALGVLAAHPAQAQEHHTYTRTRTIITHYTVRGPLTPGQKEAQRLHRQAIQLDHQATYEAKHGHPQLSAQLARQASDLNARAYRAAHR